MLESVCCIDSFGWVDCEHGVDEVLGLGGDGVPLWGGVLGGGYEYVFIISTD